MKRLKSNEHTLDRLSALPDSLIHEILSFLEMRDVVRTDTLSKRWKYLWTTVPCLEFSVSGKNSVQNRNFVSRVLTLWRGIHLRKFSIKFSSVTELTLTSDVDLWVLIAIERKVEEFCIEYSSVGPRYRPPQCLYECSSIKKLKLEGCDLQIRGSVQWDRLNSLVLSSCCLSENVINQVVSSSSSAQLETFESHYNEGFNSLSIRSSCLKKFWISTDYDGGVKHVLTIWAPKVESLNISGRFNMFMLTDVSSLTDVDLDFCGNDEQNVGEAMRQIFPAVQHVAKVGLSYACFRILVDLGGKYSFPPLLNVKVLRIGSSVTQLRELLHLFEVFPKVKMLIIDWEHIPMEVGEQFDAENYMMSDAIILKSNLLQLKTVKITLYSDGVSLTLEFLEFLLKHATMIEKIVIQTRKKQLVDSEDALQVARQVLNLQRSFPSVELIL